MNGASQQPQLVVDVPFNGSRVFTLHAGSNVVGRSTGADITVPLGSVSGHHAELWLDNSSVRIRDLGSTNGTTVNGHSINGWIPLTRGDRVRVGEAEFYLIGPGAETPEVATTSEIRLPFPPMPARPAAQSVGRTRGHNRGSGTSRSVFISYAHEDDAIAQSIGNYLRDQGWQVLRDRDFLEPGEIWSQRVATAIGQSSVVLALLSPAAAGSQWVNKELVAATNMRRPVMPLVLDDSYLGVVRERMALVVDSHWYTYNRLDPDGLKEVDSHLRRLATRNRPYRAVLPQERLGSTLIALGGAVMLVSIVVFGLGMVRAAAGMGSFFDAITSGFGDEPGAEQQAVDAWRAAASDMLEMVIIAPVAFGAIALISVGYSIRKRARRRRLIGH